MKKRKQFILEQGKDEIISAGGNAVAGSYLNAIFRSSIPENFIDGRADAISDRDVLATMTGLLSNAHTDFTNVKLYASDEVFTSSFGIKNLPSEKLGLKGKCLLLTLLLASRRSFRISGKSLVCQIL